MMEATDCADNGDPAIGVCPQRSIGVNSGPDCFPPATVPVGVLRKSLVGSVWESRCSARSRVDGVRSKNSRICAHLSYTATGFSDCWYVDGASRNG